MDAETIKDFLISLGFQIDDAGAKKFDSVIAGVTANVFKMAAVVEGAALTVTAFTAKIASGLDDLYWASQRTGATVAGIKAIGYAASQTGSNAAAAQGSLESLSRFIRNNPGAEGFLNRLGVQTRDASGNMRDMSAVFTSVGQQLSKMPYYRANQYAQMLGIDENTLMAMRRGLTGFTAEYSAMAKVISFNADQAAVSSNRFMTSLRDFSAMAGMARDKIGSNLSDGLAGSIDNLRKQILDNFPKIEDTITRGVKGILWLADAIGRVVFRLIQAAGDIRQWFNNLDSGTQKLIAAFGGLLVAWKLLNSAFLTSPIGMITALIGSLVLLYDDYKTWKEGGKSLINWAEWEPGITSALKGIDQLLKSVKGLAKEVGDLFGIDPKTWTAKWELDSLTHQFSELAKMLDTIGKLLNAIQEGRWSDVAKLGKDLFTQGKDNPSAMPGVEKNAQEMREKAIGFWQDIKSRFKAGGWYEYQRQNGDPEQHAQSARKIKNADLPGTVAGQFNQTVDRIKSQKFADSFTDALLRLVNMAAAQTNTSSTDYSMPEGDTTPKPTTAGAALLGWLQPTFSKLEALYKLPEGLLKSVAITESAGDPNAVSDAGAQGLFQIMPGTGKDLGLRGNDAFDPLKSAQAAAKYLSQLMKQNGGDLDKTLASYNWGIGNVQKYGMALAPRETREYVPKVKSNLPVNTLNQETHITVYGATDPRATANEIGQHQTAVNSRANQQMYKGPG
ncbi:MAG: transglycosylase SLT domain-containing protein [Ewingella americana]|jgi:soluble lytic murein transglycosylase-like protein|uniref:transglycosylase SLT domain-containing protein n=1 Tax=Ewingella americana TaxID=41202 RepID=UPI00242CD6D0|nr:transglycosylase SLT domain-containing protein [Ewingella americana]MCI1676637.1 transglycosylase SLT domain-containing protein [Ewingella americana]MCI1853773.1 transglycosylase SLT domain-containing protein [Ewingella americana]MCI1859986.1 transglycosylase SLT domain-containing protein [Ewingella americana]MCI2142314.1 transglycosylase SLT domain-containing protein [Ewingella americana]MCI2163277.1 transglycosylase SLT domain-containing protein [Ewingella americana]